MAVIKVEAGRPATEKLLKIANSLSFDSFSLLDLALPWLNRSRSVEVYPVIEPQTGHPYLGLRYFESGIDVGGLIFKAELLAEGLSHSELHELLEYDSFLGLSTLSRRKPVLSTRDGMEVTDAAALSGDLTTSLALSVKKEAVSEEKLIEVQFEWLTKKDPLIFKILLE